MNKVQITAAARFRVCVKGLLQVGGKYVFFGIYKWCAFNKTIKCR